MEIFLIVVFIVLVQWLKSFSAPLATNIGGNAFNRCRSLENVKFGSEITTFGNNVFGGSTNPANIDLYLHANEKPASGKTWRGYEFKNIYDY